MKQVLGPNAKSLLLPGSEGSMFICIFNGHWSYCPKTSFSHSTELEKIRTPESLTPKSSIRTQVLLVPSDDHLTASGKMTFSAHYVQVGRGQRWQWCLSKTVFGK